MDWFLYDNGLHHERVKQKNCAKGIINLLENIDADYIYT